MKLNLEKSKSIVEFKEAFSLVYPYLKLEFFTKSHDPFKASPSKFLIHDETTKIGELLKENLESGELDISANVTVNQLESNAENALGLHIQVMRKSGNNWLVTTVTDNLTLAEQNDKGHKSTIHHEKDEPIDYREID